MAKKIKSIHVIKQKDLIESFDNSFSDITERSIDSDNFIIKDVCLFGTPESANNRIYSDKAIGTLTSMAEGSKCFMDHPSKTSIRETDGVRSVNDFIGIFENSRREGNKVIANLQCRESYFDLLKDIALMQPHGVGMSINSRVKVFQDEKGVEHVADIDTLRSTDLVSSAATTSNLWESLSEKIEENKNDELDILLETTESRVKDKFKILMVEEGIIQDQLDNEKIQDEIRDVTWVANRLLDKTIHDSELNITDKKSKIIEIFDDLESEIRKRLSGIKESLKENKRMDLQTLKTEHPELVKVILKEAQKADNVVKLEVDLEKSKTDLQEASDKVDELTKANKTEAKDLNKKIEDLEKELTEAKDKNSELEKELDEIKVAEAFADKKAKINKQISESKLPKDAVTDVWVNDLMKLEDIEEGATVEDQVKERITDRTTLINKESGKVKGSGEEFTQDLKEGNKNKKSTEDAGKDFLEDSKY